MIATYIRFSTEKQDSMSQRHAIKTYADSKGIDLTHAKEYLDESVSGTENDRQGLNQLLCDIDKGLVSTILTTELSRLSRDMFFLINLLSKINTKHVKLITVNEGEIKLKESMDIFIVVAKTLVAATERELISRRTKEALAALKAKGVKLGPKNPIGRKKYIYRPDPKQLERVKELKRRGLSFADISYATGISLDKIKRMYRRSILKI